VPAIRLCTIIGTPIPSTLWGPKLTLSLDPHTPIAHPADTDVAVAHPGPDGSQQHAGTPLYPYFGVKALGDRGV
jgi:hypothetical protein